MCKPFEQNLDPLLRIYAAFISLCPRPSFVFHAHHSQIFLYSVRPFFYRMFTIWSSFLYTFNLILLISTYVYRFLGFLLIPASCSYFSSSWTIHGSNCLDKWPINLLRLNTDHTLLPKIIRV